MAESDSQDSRLLVEYHLDLLEGPARAQVESRLAADAEFSRQLRVVRRLMDPLKAWQAPPPDLQLVDRIMERVATTTPLHVLSSSTSLSPEPSAGRSRRPVVSLWELGALAACVALFMSIFVPGMANIRSRQIQAQCGNNLASLASGFQTYAADYQGSLPMIAQRPGTNWLQQPNILHEAPLLRFKFVIPSALLCPGGKSNDAVAGPLDSDEAIARFLGQRLEWYSNQNRNGPVAKLTFRLRMPVAADPNPVFEGGKYNGNVPWDARSRAHDGRGQNVMFSDGSVEFRSRPEYGDEGDNIWRAEPIDNYNGTESQRSATDAFLIP